MLIGICGSICAGKKTVAQYLVDHHGFKHLYVKPPLGSDDEDESTEGEDVQPNLKEPHNDDLRPKHAGVLSRPFASRQPSTASHARTFETPDELLNFVTSRWRERWVTTDITNDAVLDAYARRPFFLLISVDAPLTVRWQRYKSRRPPSISSHATATTLEDFVTLSDEHLYSPTSGHAALLSRASVRLLNTSSSLHHLYATLGKVDLLNEDRLRPSWDSYFMSLASLAAQRSNCMKRRVGCVLIRSKRVISTGYNGTPRNIKNCGEGGCPRCNSGDARSGQGLATCLCIHAEENALLEAGRERIESGLEGAILYCDTCPCLTCSIKIVQVGIREVVYAQGYSMDGETAAVFREAGVRLRQFIPPANGLIHLEKMELYA